ncbi:MAG: hypothetical protein ACD_10C00271G0001 [uncultured bacterium]|nr:MAG: hypothetical protein ACD_10C00271G0001 [uncultured bacterium]
MRGDFLAFAHCGVQILRQVDAFQLTHGKLDQFGAEILQFVHGLLDFGLGGAAVTFGEIFF